MSDTSTDSLHALSLFSQNLPAAWKRCRYAAYRRVPSEESTACGVDYHYLLVLVNSEIVIDQILHTVVIRYESWNSLYRYNEFRDSYLKFS